MNKWKETILSELVKVGRGSSPRPIHDYLSSAGIPWVKISDASASNTRFINQTKQFIKEGGRSTSVSVGDLIVSNSATPGIPKIMGIDACVHDGWLVFGDYKNIDKMYLYYFFLDYRKTLEHSASGSVFVNLQTEIVKNIKLFLPPVKEQKAIAAVLSSLDDKIELLRKQNETLEKIAQTIFKRWFVEFEFPVNDKASADKSDKNKSRLPAEVLAQAGYKSSGGKMIESEMGEIPEGWRVSFLNELIEDSISGEWGKENKIDAYIKNVVCLRGTDLPDIKSGNKNRAPARFIKEIKYENCKIEEGDIVIEISGGTEGQSTGRSVYINRYVLEKFNLPLVCVNFCKILRPKEKTITYFIYSYLEFLYKKGVFFNLENGTTGIKNLNLKSLLNNYDVVMPQKKYIYIFHDTVNDLFRKIQINNNQIQTLSRLRDTLLPKLMSGEVRVK